MPKHTRQRGGAIDQHSLDPLLGMGFERADAIRALKKADNDVEAAANLLLSQGSSMAPVGPTAEQRRVQQTQAAALNAVSRGRGRGRGQIQPPQGHVASTQFAAAGAAAQGSAEDPFEAELNRALAASMETLKLETAATEPAGPCVVLEGAPLIQSIHEHA